MSSGKSAVPGGAAGPSSALQPTVPRRPVVVPSSSRASARAQRRIQASAARRRTSSEVLLLTSKAFPPERYQELLTFLKGLHLPPDATSLFTTVRNDQFANKKALVSSSSKEVDEVLGRYGGDWALLSLCADELGLGGARQGPGSPSSRQRSRELSSGLSASMEAAGQPASSGQAPPRFSGAEWRFSGDLEMPALSQKWAERPPRTDGVVRRAGGGGYSLSVEALGVPFCSPAHPHAAALPTHTLQPCPPTRCNRMCPCCERAHAHRLPPYACRSSCATPRAAWPSGTRASPRSPARRSTEP